MGRSGGFQVDGLYRVGLVALLLIAAGATWGCSCDAPAPIPDPGGPFHTNVAANKSLSSLTDGEVQDLCTAILIADKSFLIDAITTEEVCRGDSVSRTDAGAEFLTACQAAYDNCKGDLASGHGALGCPLPALGCNATVDLVSACLNELAATNPVSTCVHLPTCEAAANPPFDGGTRDLSNLPARPACDRLGQECPDVSFGYPCQ